ACCAASGCSERKSYHASHERRLGMKRAVAAILTLIVLSGCASSTPPPPSVYVNPTRGQTPEQQVRDQNDCVQIAKQQTGYDPALDTAKGAGVGAAIGALGGAAAGEAIVAPDLRERVGERRSEDWLVEHHVGARVARAAHERLVVARHDDDARPPARKIVVRGQLRGLPTAARGDDVDALGVEPQPKPFTDGGARP